MIVLFPFEKEFYYHHGINVECVGHPLLDIVKSTAQKTEFLSRYGFSDKNPTIALLPGSRRSEIRHILPVMEKSARLINRKMGNAQFLVAKSPHLPAQLYEQILKNAPFPYKVIEGKTYDVLGASDFALVCSGTATL